MQRNDEVLTVEPCDICGDVGYPELLVTCSKCNVIHQHCYCMQILLKEVPDVWFCEYCQSKNGTTSPCKVNQDTGLQATKRFLHKDEVIELSSCNFPAKPIPTTSTLLMTRKAYVGSKNVTPKIPSLALKSNPCISPMVLPRNEVQKNQMTDHAPHSSSKVVKAYNMTRSQMRGYDSSKLKKVRVRYECKTRWIAEVNKNLTPLQKSRIEATPFKWLMCLRENLNISGKLLRELARRWDERSEGFIVASRIVHFSPLDVCFALGLRIVGENVQVEEDTKSECKRLFNGKQITVKTIFEKLMKLHSDDDVEDFCRLYILLGFAEFYFPKSNPIVHDRWFKPLDDLQSLDKYKWGLAVYEFLVKGLTRAAISLRGEKNSSQLHIIGCAVVLQVWACEHVLVSRRITSKVLSRFPRFLKWHDVSIGETNISASLKQNLVIEELSATNEELAHDVVREALDLAPSEFIHWKRNDVNSAFDMKELIREHRLLAAKNKEIEARISALEQDLREIKQLLCQSEMSTKPAGP